jgi:hypothetical protein
VANFELSTANQQVTLVQGWNWFVPTVDITLEQLEDALGTSGVSIMSQYSGSTIYDDGDDEWTGQLKELNVGQMYIIQTNDNIEFTLNGTPAPAISEPITIVEGYNWIGYTGNEVSITQALSSFEPADGDCIMAFGEEGSVNYDADDEEWTGYLRSLKPGHGYIYISKDPNPKQLTLQGCKK